MKSLALVALALVATCGSVFAQSSNLQGANIRLDAATYQQKTEKGAANGYAPLNASSLVPPGNLFPNFGPSPDGTIWIKSGTTLAPVPGSGLSAAGDALTLGTVTIGNTGIGSTRGISVNSGTSPLLFKAGSSNQVFVEFGQTFGAANAGRNGFLWSIDSDGTFALKDGTFGGIVNFQSNNATNMAQASGTAMVVNFGTGTITTPAGNMTLTPNAGAGGIIIPSTGGSANPTWALNTTAATNIFGRKDLVNTWTLAQTFSVAPVVPNSSFTIAKTTGLQAAIDLALKRDGTNAPTAHLTMGGFKITNLADATGAGDAVSMGFADGRYALTANTVSSLAINAGTPLSLNGATGNVVITQLSATAARNGYLTMADWSTFNGKENALTFSPNTILTRSGNTVTLLQATGSQGGYLSSADWTTFNAKEAGLTFSSPLSRSVNTISILPASGSQNGYLASGDFTNLQSITTGYSSGQIPIGNAGGFTKATLTAGSFISITNAPGSITVALNGLGFGNGELLIGDIGLNGGLGGLRKGTIVAGSGIGVTNGAGSITISATGGGAGTGYAGVSTTTYQLVPATDPSAVENAYTTPLADTAIVGGKFFKVVAHGRLTATASGDKFSFWLYHGAQLVAGPLEYTTTGAETTEPFSIEFENTVRSTGGGLATVYTQGKLVIPKTATRSTDSVIGSSTSIANFPDATDNLTIKVQSNSSDAAAGITNDRIFVEQAYLNGN